LSALVASAKQNYEVWTIPSKVNPVTWPKVGAAFNHSFANGTNIAKISLGHSAQDLLDTAANRWRQAIHPEAK
jgi:hypothetical protein